MKSIFKTFVLSLLIIAQMHFVYAQTASIIPPAKTTFVDQNGKPLTSGTVDFYIPSTSTRKATWQDAGETILNTNPVVLDAAGRGLILGSGSYRQVVKDRVGNVIWDQVTSSVGSGGGGGTNGDGLPVGSVIPWSGFSVPNGNYAFTYGQELSRTTYSELFLKITLTQNVVCTSGSATLSSISDTSQLNIGAAIESACVPAASVIVSKTASTVTLNNLAIVSTSATAVFFPYGNGNATTTFNVPDYRGVVLPGRCNMGGSSCSVISNPTYTDPNALYGIGGGQSFTLTTPNLPAYVPAGLIGINDPGHNHTINNAASIVAVQPQFGGADVSTGGGVNTSTSATGITATFTGAAQGGISAPFRTIQPSKTTNYVIKILADQPATAIAIIIGTTQITNGSNTNIIYNNNGVAGEYPLTTANQYNCGTAGSIVQPNVVYQAETVTTYGTTTAFDFCTFKNTSVTLTGNITTMAITNLVAGKAGMITYVQDGAGGHTTVFNSILKFTGGVTPTLTTTPGAVDILTYSCRSATFCGASLLTDVK